MSRINLFTILSFSFVLSGQITAEDALQPRMLPGQRADGTVLLPNQWSLSPAGTQTPLGDNPVNIAMHPKGKFASILHCGHSKHEIITVEIKSGKTVSRTPVEEAFYGISFSYDGSMLYCSGASGESVHVFKFKDGTLTAADPIQLREPKLKGIPAGLTASRDGTRLYVANVWAHSVTSVDPQTKEKLFEIQLFKGAQPTVATPKNEDFDTAANTKRAEAEKMKMQGQEPFPYACVLDEKNNRLYVSLWALSSVAVIDLNTQKVINTIQTEEHPTEMVLTRSAQTLYVANANRNTVSVIDTTACKVRETLYASLYPNLPPGATPMSLALTPDEKILFVANATLNAIAVFDVSENGKSRAMGFIPAGWYPTSVRVTPDGKRLLIANGKGGSSKPNPAGPKPGSKEKNQSEYIARLLTGTLSVLEIPKFEKFEEELKAFTAQVYKCTPIHADLSVTLKRPDDSPVPLKPGDPSPIKYCIYVVKENRTYDQILGDIKEGNGEPGLCLFPEKVTPNHHKLARDFVLLDNFYVDAEVSADGHEWSMAAYATDFVEKSWPLAYGHNKSGKFPYPSEGRFPVAIPASGYIWDRAREAGVTYRSYGEFVDNGKTPKDPCTTRLPALKDHFAPFYRSFDVDYPDAKRVEEYIRELKEFEKEGDMPRLQIVRIPNDHTAGAALGAPTPTAYLAENDAALGKFVEAVSRSKFWPQTAIFVLEDDAQNGSDHVDAHRSIAFVISPYTKRNSVDSNMYSTSSMIRTMELILGMQPMTHYDAAAAPMYGCFTAKPDLRPYDALPPNVSLEEKNQKSAWGGKQSQSMDFSKEDSVDDLLLNEIIWRSVRGPDSHMPAPVRAAFVFTRRGPKTDDDD